MRPTTAETLKAYMRRVAERVGVAVAAEVSSLFGLMFDGWSSGLNHYIGVYTVYHGEDGHRERLIGLSPMVEGQTADAHIESLNAILGVYEKGCSMVKFLVGDNCSTNQSNASKLDIPLVGCASHRFNLAMGKFLSEYEDQISRIQNLMTRLRQTNNAAELAGYTPYVPIRANATRWSSVFEMIQRYIQTREAICKVAAVEDLVPRGASHRRVVGLHDKLEELNSVCVKLQYERRTLGEVRALFDACLEKYPIMGEHLKAGARILHSPDFEAAVVKMTCGVPLSTNELKTLLPFRRTEAVQRTAPDEPSDFATDVLRLSKKPRRAEPTVTDYAPLLATIPPTSNRCERLFSECKYVLTPHRSAMHPATFEMLMFLEANRELWNSSTLLP